MAARQLQTVGWDEWVALPKLNIPAIKAKVDTGAKTSSLHAFSIEVYGTKRRPKVRFGIHPIPDRPDIELYCSAPLVDQRVVTSSNGDTELRCIIETTVQVGMDSWPIEVSLTNRETMAYRMLLGRSAMVDRLTVDPTRSCMLGHLPLSLYDNLVPQLDAHQRLLNIGILTRQPNSYSTMRLYEAAEERGHDVELIDTKRCYIQITSTNPTVHYAGEPLTGLDVIIPRIGASTTFYGLAVVRQFESMGLYVLNPSDAISRSRDKLYAHQVLARNGIGMPDTAFAHSPHDTKDVLNMMGSPPMVLKLLEGAQGKGVVLAETKKAAESVVNAFRQLDANILVQQFIKESGGSDIRCFVVGNRVVAAMKRQAAEGDFRSNLHQGGKPEKIKITKEERETAVKAAKVLGLRVAGVDILRSNDGPKVLEVNSSPGLQGIEAITRKDIASKIIEYVERHAIPKRTRPR